MLNLPKELNPKNLNKMFTVLTAFTKRKNVQIKANIATASLSYDPATDLEI